MTRAPHSLNGRPEAAGDSLPRTGAGPEANGARARETVLLIDDEEAVRRPCVKVLERGGFTVVQAGNGREGLDLFEKHYHDIAVVVLDVLMPNTGGWEVLSQLRERAPEIPVLMISGYADWSHDPADDSPRPDRFLRKPFELRELLGVVSELAQGERSRF